MIAGQDSLLSQLASVRAEIDLEALRHNAQVLKGIAGDAGIMAAVKADAYGHGAVEVAQVLEEDGIAAFAVASVAEGIALRNAGIESAIHVLGAPVEETLPLYVRHRLMITVTSSHVVDEIVAAAAVTGPLIVHVKVDTGMHRLGVAPDEVSAVLERLRKAQGVVVEGIWTHFATVDRSFTLEQLARFDSVILSLVDPPPVTHVANSGAMLYLPETVRNRTLVRVGGALYGMVIDRIEEQPDADLKPVMRVVSRVVHLQEVRPGESVSYGRTWVAERKTTIATVAAGYGDGIHRALSNKGLVGIQGKTYPIVGRVCMDMLMVDLGENMASVDLGDEVVLFGQGGPTVMEQAERAGTIAYELTCALTQRVARVYQPIHK